MLLIGVGLAFKKQNEELKEQTKLLEHLKLFRIANESFERDLANNCKSQKFDSIQTRTDAINEEKLIDFSLTNSVLSSTSSLSSSSSTLSRSNSVHFEPVDRSFSSSNKLGLTKICLFRKAAIAIIAANRLVYFYNINKCASVYLKNSNNRCYKFVFSENAINKNENNLFKCNKEPNCPANRIQSVYDPLFEWFIHWEQNELLISLNQISVQLNNYLHASEGWFVYNQ
jgi:hypothetical protein